MTVISSDTCIRADQSGFGTASDGSSYTMTGETITTSISSNEAVFSGNGVTANVFALLSSQTTADIDIVVRVFQSNAFDGIGVVFRYSNTSNCYYCMLDGEALSFHSIVGGTDTQQAHDFEGFSPNTFYWIHVRMVGTHIQFRYWQDGTSEPSTWNIDQTDTNISAAGRYGMYYFDNNGSVQKFDHITVDNTQTSTTSNKDLSSRLRLMSANIAKDLSGRLRLMSANQPKDLGGRFRLAKFNDLSTRLRLVASGQAKDVASRLRLKSANFAKDLSSRFWLVLGTNREDLQTRLRLRSANNLKDLATRLLFKDHYDGPPAMPIISRGVPAYTNDDDGGTYPASNANDADYTTVWRTQDLGSTTPPNVAYLAYDLSGVSTNQRKKVMVAWYNPYTGDYDFTVNGGTGYNLPRDYTIDANNAAGGSLPASGWTTLITVTGNVYHSRQHSVDLTGYNWIRIRCTAINGTTFNTGCALNLDIHNLANGIQDDFILFGDSITAGGLDVDSGPDSSNPIGSLAQLINSATHNVNFPIIEGGGIGGRTSAYGAANISTWLALFPGRYVGLAYGTNDANGSVSTATFQANMQSMITSVLSAGCYPIIPHIPWGNTTAIQANAPAMNAAIDSLIASNPGAIAGPDLWSFFNANQSLISGDDVHPNAAGYTALRQQWALALEDTVYQTQWSDLASRFRLMSAAQTKDIPSRLKLMSAPQSKDLIARFRLMSIAQAKDLVTRFRLMSANQTKDLASRFRLTSFGQAKDLLARFRLQSASQLKDLSSRLLLRSADQLRDLKSRFLLRSANQLRDIAFRFRLSASQMRDISTRLVLALASQRFKDLSTRLRLMSANQLRDVAARIRVRSADQTRDVPGRFLQRSANQLRDLATRFDLKTIGQSKDLSCRFVLESSVVARKATLKFRSGHTALRVRTT